MQPETGWQEDDSRIFAELGQVFTPGREDIERALLDLVPAAEGEEFTAVELGVGTGWLSEALLRHFPAARVIGLDGSAVMLREAERLLSPYLDRVGLREFRLEDSSWLDGLENVRCFLSSLVLHHLDGEGKRELYRRLYEALMPGGALLVADVMEPASEPARRHAAAVWSEEVRQRSLGLTGDLRAYDYFVDNRWNIYEYPDPTDQPSSIRDQLLWLEEAGFRGVDVPWARAGHAVLVGYKDTPA